MSEEHRRSPRIDSLNLSYVCVDDQGAVLEQSMGRTLNVSDSGLCLETHFKTEPSYNLVLTIALGDEVVDLKGKVAYCRAGEGDTFETGVEFVEMDAAAKEVYQKYVKHFDQQSA